MGGNTTSIGLLHQPGVALPDHDCAFLGVLGVVRHFLWMYDRLGFSSLGGGPDSFPFSVYWAWEPSLSRNARKRPGPSLTFFPMFWGLLPGCDAFRTRCRRDAGVPVVGGGTTSRGAGEKRSEFGPDVAHWYLHLLLVRRYVAPPRFREDAVYFVRDTVYLWRLRG